MINFSNSFCWKKKRSRRSHKDGYRPTWPVAWFLLFPKTGGSDGLLTFKYITIRRKVKWE